MMKDSSHNSNATERTAASSTASRRRRSSSGSTISSQQPLPEDDLIHSQKATVTKREVRFSKIHMRLYNITPEVNVLDGGVGIAFGGWDYTELRPLSLDRYETQRPERRTFTELRMDPMDRYQRLKAFGVTLQDLKDFTEGAKQALAKDDKSRVSESASAERKARRRQKRDSLLGTTTSKPRDKRDSLTKRNSKNSLLKLEKRSSLNSLSPKLEKRSSSSSLLSKSSLSLSSSKSSERRSSTSSLTNSKRRGSSNSLANFFQKALTRQGSASSNTDPSKPWDHAIQV